MVNVPQFTMGGSIRDDWMQGSQGIVNALGQWRQREMQNRQLDTQDKRYAQQDKQWNASNALAQAQFGLAQNQDARAAAKAPLELRNIEAQIAQHRAQGFSEAQLLPLKLEYQRAQTEMTKSHARFYDAASAAKSAPAPRAPVHGMRRDGTPYVIDGGGADGMGGGGGSDALGGDVGGYAPGDVGRFAPRPPPSVDSRVLGSGQTVPGGVSYETPGGTPGERALASSPEEDRQRYMTVMRERQLRETVYGKPPPNHAWSPDGKAVRISSPPETAADRQAKVIAAQGLHNLDMAERALVGKDGKGPTVGTFGQLAGDTWKVPGVGVEVGQWGAGGIAFRQAKRAITDLNFAISGKSVSNAERQAFLDLYMPKSTESTEAQRDKIRAVRAFFKQVLKARNDGSSDEDIAAMFRSKLDEGQRLNQQPVASPGVKKYGNKYQGLE